MYPSPLVGRPVPSFDIGKGLMLSDCSCTGCEIDVLAGNSPSASEVEGE